MAHEVDSLLALQRASFEAFTLPDVAPHERAYEGLDGCLRELFPLDDFSRTAELDYGGYRFGAPSESAQACRLAGTTFARELWVTVRSIRYRDDPSGERMIVDLIEEDVPFGPLPWMTDEGTFVIDGVDRVVHPQLARAPGVWFPFDGRDTAARIEPLRGTRIEYRIERKHRRLQARLGAKGRWLPATALPRALGLTREELLRRAYGVETLCVDEKGLWLRFDPARLAGRRAAYDLWHEGELLVKRWRKYTRAAVRTLAAKGVTTLPFEDVDAAGTRVATDVIDEATGEVLVGVGEALTLAILRRIRGAGVREVPVLVVASSIYRGLYDLLPRDTDPAILDTELTGGIDSVEDAQMALWSSVRPDDFVDAPVAERFVRRALCDPEQLDLTPAGRARMNRLLGTVGDARALSADDLVAVLVGLMRRTRGEVFDPSDDHPSNAVVRGVGALLAVVVREGFERVASMARERLSMSPVDFTVLPSAMLTMAPFARRMREFFTRTRVCVPVTRVNPAAVVAQARWLAAVEPDATSSKRSGFALDDVAVSQFEFLCPIEARDAHGPPGSSLPLGARVGPMGQLEARFAPLTEGVAEAPVYLDALGLGTLPVRAFDETVQFDQVAALSPHNIASIEARAVAWRSVSTESWVGAVAALVPFAMHDEVTAWMEGVRNLREAIPPLCARPPRVATTLDARVAMESGVCVRAEVSGVVARVDGRAVVVRHAEGEVTHALRCFEPAHGGVMRERACVAVGDVVTAGDVIAEGHGVVAKTLACGDDALVALMPWAGFNDACAVAVSERLVREGRLTTAQVRELTATVGRAHEGRFALDRDADDLDASERESLDDEGLVRVGQRVREGDVLAGRTHHAPRGGARRGASWRAPRGCEGVVIRAELYRPDKRPSGTSVLRVWVGERRALSVGDLVGSRHGDRGAVACIAREEDLPMCADGRAVEVVMNPAWVVERGAVGVLCEMGAACGEVRAAVSFAERFEGAGNPVTLRDGRTGETFMAPVSVGTLHLFKLSPLVDDVFEARARGPRDDATKLPVGDAHHAPGQPIADDEVWALAAYGAAHALRESLGARGDDPHAAARLDRSIERGDEAPVEAVSRGFEVFLRTLQAAAIAVEAPKRRSAIRATPSRVEADTMRADEGVEASAVSPRVMGTSQRKSRRRGKDPES
jgi:DNA-directed RNA polymerase subunit beta